MQIKSLCHHTKYKYHLTIYFFYREPNESPEDIVKNILEKLGLASSDIKPDDKIDTLCVIFKQTLTENVQ